MTVTPIDSHRHPARLAAAIGRHPSSLNRQPLPLVIDPAAAITQVARTWDRMHRDLTAGPGALDEETGWEVLQVMLGALVHPAARPGLVLTWPQLLEALRRHDQVMDGDLAPDDLSCHTVNDALAKTDGEVQWLLFPLISGLPSRDACSDCIRTCQSANQWQARLGCTNHARSI